MSPLWLFQAPIPPVAPSEWEHSLGNLGSGEPIVAWVHVWGLWSGVRTYVALHSQWWFVLAVPAGVGERATRRTQLKHLLPPPVELIIVYSLSSSVEKALPA